MADDKPKRSLLYGSRGEHLVVLQFVLFFGFVFLPVWNPLATPELLAETRLIRWSFLLLFAGAALVLGGLGVVQIRAYLTPLPYPVEHSRLVRHGAYAVVRHPLYGSQLLAALGWTAFQLSVSHLALLVVGFFFFDHKASREEQWLGERHPEYAEYARRVRKLIPWVY
jgi:protein-S-isoprenylcysteine O-methyltransferase Ste14